MLHLNQTAENIENMKINISGLLSEKELQENIEASFSGSISTMKIFNHFAEKHGVEEASKVGFVQYMLDKKEWLTKKELYNSRVNYKLTTPDEKSVTSTKSAGLQAVQTFCEFIMLNEIGMFQDGMTKSEKTELIKENITVFSNKRMVKIYKNSVVYNNLNSYKSSYLAKLEKLAETEATKEGDNSLSPETTEALEIPKEASLKLASQLADLQDALLNNADAKQDARKETMLFVASVLEEIRQTL